MLFRQTCNDLKFYITILIYDDHISFADKVYKVYRFKLIASDLTAVKISAPM